MRKYKSICFVGSILGVGDDPLPDEDCEDPYLWSAGVAPVRCDGQLSCRPTNVTFLKDDDQPVTMLNLFIEGYW